MKTMQRYLISAFVISAILLAAGCGGSSSNPTPQPPPTSEIKVSVTSTGGAAIVVNHSKQFTATVTGTTNPAVTWSVQEQAGGTVAAGLYTAPWVNGTYHVVAKSVADPTKSATATVAVSAPFAFLEKLPSGTSAPFSVTPLQGTFAADGKFATAGITDPQTGKAMDTTIESLFLSSDGTKAVFDMVMTDPNGGYSANIYMANADGTGLTQLTSDSWNSDPQFTPDGKQIIYRSEQCGPEIWMMNADGSNPHVVYGSCINDAKNWYPTVSPDGTKIAAEVSRVVGGLSYDGIAIMNLDGSNIVQLTGDLSCLGWDEMPSFTNDGKQIMFSRWCSPNDTGIGASETLYIMNLDGTNLTKLHGDGTDKVIHYDPFTVADKVVFSSNMDSPATDQFDLYSIKLDGTGLTRLTNNLLFDGMNIAWMNSWMSYSASGAAAKRVQKLKELQQRRGDR
jgi:hypothetical protein